MIRALALAVSVGLSVGACGNDGRDGAADPESTATGALPTAPSSPGIEFPTGEPLTRDDVRDELVSVRVHDPYEARTVSFRATPAVALLDARLGAGWRDADEVVFVCADGYRAGVPTWRFFEHRAHLAFERDEAAFAIDKPVGGEIQRVPLAPAYLIWENLDDDAARAAGDWGWPYQIVRVELASVAERYARLTPPVDSADDVGRGFETFRRYCVRCHAINGQGGALGPELNYPASVTEYIRPEWLRRFILDPTAVRAGTAMPGLPADVADRDVRADELLAYLAAMARRKLPPEPD